jgi:SAM-dependent methyltransferase
MAASPPFSPHPTLANTIKRWSGLSRPKQLLQLKLNIYLRRPLTQTMEIPRRKYLWSHFTPVILEDTSSDLNPFLAVALYKGRLQLLSGNAIYSWDDLYDNFRGAFGKLNIQARPPRTALVLGGGLGSIPFMLEKRFQVKNCAYTIVEYDKEVNYLACKYSYPRLKSPVEVITANAAAFMDLNMEQYDLICVDIFEDDKIPEAFQSPTFLEQCKNALKPDGLLLYNRLYQELRDVESSERFYHNTWKEVFAEGEIIKTQGNMILVGKSPR